MLPPPRAVVGSSLGQCSPAGQSLRILSRPTTPHTRRLPPPSLSPLLSLQALLPVGRQSQPRGRHEPMMVADGEGGDCRGGARRAPLPRLSDRMGGRRGTSTTPSRGYALPRAGPSGMAIVPFASHQSRRNGSWCGRCPRYLFLGVSAHSCPLPPLHHVPLHTPGEARRYFDGLGRPGLSPAASRQFPPQTRDPPSEPAMSTTTPSLPLTDAVLPPHAPSTPPFPLTPPAQHWGGRGW